MFELVIIFTCVILANTQTCPLYTYQQDYIQPEVPLVLAQPYTSPYQHQVLVYDDIESTNSLTEQIKKLLLEKVLTSPIITSLVDGNHEPTTNDVLQNIRNPSENQPKIVNNYIIIPPEIVGSNAERCQCCSNNVETIQNSKYTVKPDRNLRVAKKSKENEKSTKYSKKLSNKKKKSTNHNKSRSSIQNNEETLAVSQFPKSLKCKISELNTHKSKNLHKVKEVNFDTSSKKTKSKCSHKNKDSGDLGKKPDANSAKKIADIEVGFDIHEECTSLECRKTRNNNNYEPITNFQQYSPNEFSDNIYSYMNNIMANPQYNPNCINQHANANFPYNFDYMYQFPQQYNSKSGGSNNIRKNRRKKQKSNNVKQKQIEEPDEPLVPSNQGEEEKKLNTIEEGIAMTHSEFKPKSENKKVHKEEYGQKSQNLQMSQPKSNAMVKVHETNTAKDINLSTIPTISRENFIQYPNDNDILDDYYPDFTTDNFYLSREDYEYNKINDRFYYRSDSKGEKSTNNHKYDRYERAKDLKKQKKLYEFDDSSLEVNFKTPPPLESPDFRTTMINKGKYVPASKVNQAEVNSDKNKDNKYPKRSYSNLSINEDIDTGIETAFAQSKVVKYGPCVREKIIPLFDSKDINKNDDEIIISKNENTSVVIAKSLGYPDGH